MVTFATTVADKHVSRVENIVGQFFVRSRVRIEYILCLFIISSSRISEENYEI